MARRRDLHLRDLLDRSIWGLLLLTVGCHADASPEKPNVLLVSIDTFRADRVGAIDGTSSLTPNLDRFARGAVVFTQAYAQSTITSPSHASMFTSRYPSEFAGVSRSPTFSAEMYTLPEVLGIYGYETAAFVAGGDLNPAIGPTRGFATYESSQDFGSLWHTVPMALGWLAQADTSKPWFVFLHGYDTHVTYLKPTPYGLLHTGKSVLSPHEQELLNGTERVIDGRLFPSMMALDSVSKMELRPRSEVGRQRLQDMARTLPRAPSEVSADEQELIRDVYDGAVSYADTMFGVLLARLQQQGDLDNTIIAVMGDHGEALGEGGLFHRCCTMEDELTRVPLMVRLPGGAGGGHKVDALVGLIDLMPTLLDLVGAPAPADVRGMSLGPAIRGEPFVGHPYIASMGGLGLRIFSVRNKDGRMTYTGVQALSDLAPEIVAAARPDGPSFVVTGTDKPEVRAELKADVVEWLRRLEPAPIGTASTAMPDELREELRRKGYWDAQ